MRPVLEAPAPLPRQAPEEATLLERARAVLLAEADAVAALAPRRDGGFLEAVELIAGSAGRVIVSGLGKSGLVGRKIAATWPSWCRRAAKRRSWAGWWSS